MTHHDNAFVIRLQLDAAGLGMPGFSVMIVTNRVNSFYQKRTQHHLPKWSETFVARSQILFSVDKTKAPAVTLPSSYDLNTEFELKHFIKLDVLFILVAVIQSSVHFAYLVIQ